VLIEVAVGAPVRGTFTYEVEDDTRLAPGQRLLVPFGRRKAIGFHLGPAAAEPAGELRFVDAILDDVPVFPPDVLQLIRFAADYYLYPLGEALRTALPPDLGRVRPAPEERAPAIESVTLLVPHETARGALSRSKAQAALVEYLAARGGSAALDEIKVAVRDAAGLARKLEEKGFVRIARVEAPRPDRIFEGGEAPRPTPDQVAACEEIAAASGGFQPFLLHGVTGSGKTEVYLRAIEQVRARGGGALVLVPEIALTPQLAGRFRSRFGGSIAVLHSGLSDRERTREHHRLLSGEASIALGVRSAVFAPVRDLGVVVVDEEHEPSFKQEEKLRYHARDLAVYRARIAGVPCVLGSATPSLESLANARDGRYRLIRLPDRVDARPLPEVRLVDLAAARREAREAGARAEEPAVLGPELFAALEETLEAGRQSILFLNRRGNASLVLCPSCGEGARCPDCDVSLTHHLTRGGELRCHYCDFRTPKPQACPGCHSELLVLGVGTERVERELAEKLRGARVLRLDRDAAGTSAELTRILASFARGEADVLVGTQMVAKGHDFPGVTLVGAVLADVGLGLPDFRAAERTFQLLTQVAGRAGRGKDPGRVIIQTFNPAADAVACVRTHDYETFSAAELSRRRELGYPPFGRGLAVRLEAEDPRAVEAMARRIGEAARRWSQPSVRVLGPAPAPIARLRGRTRYQLLLLAPGPGPLQAIGRRLTELADGAGKVRVALDMDPVSML